MKQQLLMSWSTGKDSAWALYRLLDDPRYEVVGLFSSMNEKHNRVSMHAVRRRLARLQAEAAGLPLTFIELPDPCSNDTCDRIMGDFVTAREAEGIECMAFGDLFLEDVRAYREGQLADTGIDVVLPLWGKPTPELALEMVAAGLKAVVTCVNPDVLDASFVGRQYDAAFLDDLPDNVDPCGENGEFHTFVYAGPMFSRALPVEVGDIVERGGFAFADVCLACDAAIT
jgi:uncharacterized protein (TIGR00290 family)